ncbi:baseplate J/gp47 family protein [Kingella bonacorsii]|jgi:baseplate J-like protein|uniref:Baseplate J/gp47 family protein n=1 Tax=Kingella bonacorsii TaxID=2796361 RepID=A0ABS1BW59_9NEIS|nr:baseplate J/gp47 family protein [Kingella bonacorsii]MBK0397492.1 baseplate J/gp47 family protein [Kingella bonacorsii]DAQ28103.1 MAG TPA: Baseplate J like protein [Caudoviricetes sp.]
MFTPPNFDTIRAAILRDTQSLIPDADISADSDHYVHASRLASCAAGQYAHQTWITRQIFPDTADTDYLERHAALRGITRRAATRAGGMVTISGTAGARLAAGAQIKLGNRFYTTRTDAVIDGSLSARVPIVASEAGEQGNCDTTAGQLMAASAGISSDVMLSATGGTDAENDASLLSRLLERIRRPPAGGNRHDYKNWALSVDGVSSAYVYPLRRGLGTVDVAITSANQLPSAETLAAVQNYIDAVRPVTAKNVRVLAPDITRVDVRVRVKLAGADWAAAQREIQAALDAYFDALIPADDVVVSQLEAVISNAAGVVDRVLLAPRANLTADTVNKIEWFKLGSLNMERMA